jgi:transcriptional regulator with XRE-family HTH domain|tara:strand:+ start:853 stop:1059 length:207 start_codon:yes stop_codon:yes gene_type:complete
MTTLTKTFGSQVRVLRTSCNITQEQLANLANIDRGHMGHIERGSKSPSLDKVEKIANALKVSAHSLLG